ncbi:MAG: hypothetical protein RID81_28515 [Sandaracinaceae bacterium]
MRTYSVVEPRCHACDRALDGEPAGWGVLLVLRGGRPKRERLPLCEDCAGAISWRAARVLEEEDEG